MTIDFKNLIVGLHDLYIFNTHVKFRANWMLFTILSINLFVMHNYKQQQNLKFKDLCKVVIYNNVFVGFNSMSNLIVFLFNHFRVCLWDLM